MNDNSQGNLGPRSEDLDCTCDNCSSNCTCGTCQCENCSCPNCSHAA